MEANNPSHFLSDSALKKDGIIEGTGCAVPVAGSTDKSLMELFLKSVLNSRTEVRGT